MLLEIDLDFRTNGIVIKPFLIGFPHFVIIIFQAWIIIELFIITSPFFDTVFDGIKITICIN